MDRAAMSCFASKKSGDPSSPRLRRDKAYLYPLRLSRRNAMEPDEASAARREIGHEAPPPVGFYEMFVAFSLILRNMVLPEITSHFISSENASLE